MACNVYEDVHALRGLLETSSQFFDELFIVHAGPGGAYSKDGTIELCESFGAKIVFDDINNGYGIIRSRCIHDHGCEWGMILDADERFFPLLPVLNCEGNETWDLGNPARRPNLSIHPTGEVLNQGQKLRQLISDPNLQAITSIRRHWLDFSLKNPSQNWFHIPDYQRRIARNKPEIQYNPGVKMHEQFQGASNIAEPNSHHGIFHDHYHCFFRKAFPGSKEFNEQNYSRLGRGEPMQIK